MDSEKSITNVKGELGTDLFKIIRNFFPDMLPLLRQTNDWRNKSYITYPHEYLLMEGVFMYLMRIKSRKDIKPCLDNDKSEYYIIENLNKLFGTTLKSVGHGDTINKFLLKFDSAEICDIPVQLTNRLIRKRCFEKLRFLDKYYLVAIDGTGTASFKESASEKELLKVKDGKCNFFQYVVDSKMVFKNGFISPMGSEFIENSEKEFDKQDCEQNGTKRLMKKIKNDFRCLKICVLLDGLSANEPIITNCEEYKWKYFITLRSGSLKTVHSDYEGLISLKPENYKKNGEQDIYWMNDMDYRGHKISILKCIEPDKKNPSKKNIFMYITNFTITSDNVVELLNDGARLRWKIENENFNFEKNDLNFKHLYSRDYEVIKSLFYLMQIAHLIFLVFIYGFYVSKKKVRKIFGSLRRFAEKILLSLIARPVSDFNVRIRLSLV
ncbi:MAG TPA: transposase [Candidatus Moranbacteria bacterium]|nr:transposase [Candidatus Moranbacteria bacterium]